MNTFIDFIECEATDQSRKCNWRATRVIPKGTGFCRSQPLNLSHFENPQIEKLLKSKNGVSLKDSYDFGTVSLGKSAKQAIDIRSINKTIVILKNVSFQGGPRCPFKLCNDLPIKFKNTLLLNVECLSQNYGKTKVLATFQFESSGTGFSIGKHYIPTFPKI